MTGQLKFDSHVMSLLETTVRLVNALTPGWDGGRELAALQERALREAVSSALPGRPGVTRVEARLLGRTTDRARSVFEAVAAGDLDAAAARVNALLDATRVRPRLDRFDDAGWSLHFHGPDDSVGRGWAAGMAAGLALAVGSDLAGRLGSCAAPVCDRVFVDTSKNGGRKFCSTRCQSRVKAAAHRARAVSVEGGRVGVDGQRETG